VTQRARERERNGKTERVRERHTERQNEREREKQRDRASEREKQRDSASKRAREIWREGERDLSARGVILRRQRARAAPTAAAPPKCVKKRVKLEFRV
jgi:hypothetical protein